MTSFLPLRQALAQQLAGPEGRAVLDAPADFRPAAVLVPLIETSLGTELLFTVRAAGLTHHASQISFPGGALERGESPEQAARRETLEEIGVMVAEKGILGRLPQQISPARYVITPVVAWLAWPQPLRPNRREVDEVFSAPLGELLRVSPRLETRHFKGRQRTLHHYQWRERLIWGMTGNVLASLLEHLKVLSSRGLVSRHR